MKNFLSRQSDDVLYDAPNCMCASAMYSGDNNDMDRRQTPVSTYGKVSVIAFTVQR